MRRRTTTLQHQSSSILHHFLSSPPSMATSSLLQANTNNLSPSFTLPSSPPHTKMHIFLHTLHFHTNFSIPKVSTDSMARRRRMRRSTECYYHHRPHSCWPENYHHHHHHYHRGDQGDNNITTSSRNKARAFAPSLFRHLSCDSTEDASAGKLVDHANSPIGIHHQSYSEKVVVAVDVDEVLGNFLSALNMFIADRYSSKHSISDYHVYEFFKIWNCTRDEADIRVHEFFKTSYFKSGIHPIPGARQTLQKLSRFCNLSVVTSRQNAIKDQTIEWIDKHYPGLFQEIQFGNHFSLEGQSRPKSDICRSLGAKILIDDNPRYASECAEAGMMVLLFDYDNSYPWSKTGSVSQHPLVTKVHNWKEVENELLSWIASEKL